MKRKTIMGVLLSMVMLISLLTGAAVNTYAADDSGTGLTTLQDEYNIMLVIDKSGSMNNSDANHIAQDAACMFVDSLQVANCNIGLVTFSKESTLITDPIDVSSSKNRRKLRKYIKEIQYDAVGTGGTDLGKAVGAAADVLKDKRSYEKKNLIIMFTDGYTEGVKGEALEESNKILEEGISTAKELECEVYAIGLNSNGGIVEEGVNQIAYITSQTQMNKGINDPSSLDSTSSGKVNYLVTDSPNEIYTFYIRMFALLNGANVHNVEPEQEDIDGKTYTTFPIDISDSLVKEVDIYLTSDSNIDVDSLMIRDPEDKQVKDDDSISISSGEHYSFIKLTNPTAGTWKVSILGDVQHRLSYVTVTDVDIDISYGNWENGERNVYVSALSNGEYIADENFYSSIEKNITFNDNLSDNKLENQELQYDGSLNSDNGGLYYTVLDGALPDGEYTVSANIKNDSIDKTVEAKDLFVVGGDSTSETSSEDTASEDTVSEEPTEDADYSRDEEGNILLYDIVSFTCGDTYSYDIAEEQKYGLKGLVPAEVVDLSNEGEIIKLTQDEGMVIELTADKTGTDKCDITFICDDGQTCVLRLTCTSKVNMLMILLIIALVLILIVIAIIIIKRKTEIVVGSMYVSVMLSDYRQVNLTWNSLRGHSFSLYKLLKVMTDKDPSQEVMDIKNEIDKLKGLLDGYKLVITTDVDSESGVKYKTYCIKEGGRESGLPTFIDVVDQGETLIRQINVDFQRY